jgi:hypothetical protein
VAPTPTPTPLPTPPADQQLPGGGQQSVAQAPAPPPPPPAHPKPVVTAPGPAKPSPSADSLPGPISMFGVVGTQQDMAAGPIDPRLAMFRDRFGPLARELLSELGQSLSDGTVLAAFLDR